MTVKRTNHKDYKNDVRDVLNAIDIVLQNGQKAYYYVATEKHDNSIMTTIKPNSWPMLLSTKLHLDISSGNDFSTIRVSTQSQWFILGDVFNCYNRYIKDFFKSVDSEIQK